MTEQEWFACNDPEVMLGQLQGRVSDRKALLAKAAAFRYGKGWVQVCQRLDNDLRDLPTVMDLAERLAEGVLSQDEAMAQEWLLMYHLEDLGFGSSETFCSTFASWVDNLVRYCAEYYLAVAYQAAWHAARHAAWGYWRDAVKDHPLLNDAGKVRAHMIEVTSRNYNLDFGGGPCDPWDYARYGPVLRSDVHDPTDLIEADSTRTAAWDCLWDEAWLRAWAGAWEEETRIPWATVWASLKEGGRFSEKDWSKALEWLRDKAWELGPWRGDDIRSAVPSDSRPVDGFFYWLHDDPYVFRDGVELFLLRAEPARRAAILREIFGCPIRSVSLDPAWLQCNGAAALRLAQAAYDERRLPEGTLEPGRLAVLGDALEEAACADTAILSHLRGPGPHFRGCWAVDLLLGKR